MRTTTFSTPDITISNALLLRLKHAWRLFLLLCLLLPTNLATAVPNEANSQWHTFATATVTPGSQTAANSITAIDLTDEEKSWIQQNHVKVGVEEWMPLIAAGPDGTVNGIAGGYLRLIKKYTGLRYEVVSDLWDPLLNDFSAGRLDLLPATYYTDDRATYGLYTKPYFNMREFFYIRDDNPTIQSAADLSHAKIAVVKGYGTIPKIRASFPDATIVETIDLLHSVNAVLNGEVDAMMEAQMVTGHFIRQEAIVGLKSVSQSLFPSSSLHMFSSKEHPILLSILQKGLNAITTDERQVLLQKWLFAVKSDDVSVSAPHDTVKTTIVSDEANVVLWLSVITVVVFVMLLGLAYALPQYLSDDILAKQFGSSKVRLGAIAMLTVIVFLVLSLVWYTLEKNRKSTLASVGAELQFVLNATTDMLDYWIDERRKMLVQLGRDPQLVALTKQLLLLPTEQAPLSRSIHQHQIRAFFRQRESSFGSEGFFIINQDNVSIGSRRDSNLGMVNTIAEQVPEYLVEAFKGNGVFIEPIAIDLEMKISNKPLNSTHFLTTFFAAPIVDADGHILAILTQRLSPGGRLSKILQQGRIGQTGESYLVNKKGKMLTDSRFAEHLKQIGLLSNKLQHQQPNQPGAQLLEVRDPGGNMVAGYQPQQPRKQQPLTLMAEDLHRQSLLGNSDSFPISSNLAGYRDYRGVPVFGAWRWIPQLGVGITTEIDVDEAMAGFHQMRINLLVVVSLTLLLTIASTLLTLTIGQRATRAMQKGKNELEDKVLQRTKALKSREESLWDLYEHAPVAYASVDPKSWAFVKHNVAFADLLGQNREAFAALKWHDLLVKGNGDSGIERVAAGMVIREKELQVLYCTSDILHVLLTAIPAYDKTGNLDEIRLTLIDLTERKAGQERFSALMESAPDAMVVINRDGDLLLVNSQVEKLFGYGREALLAGKIEMLTPQSIRASHIEFRNRFFDNPSVRMLENNPRLNGLRKNGELFPAEVSLSPLYADEGLLVVAVIRDVTERCNAQQIIAKNNRDLSTLTLINDAVAQALTEAQLLNDICRIIKQASELRLVWVGYEIRDYQYSIEVMASAGTDKGFLEQTAYCWSKDESVQGPTGKAIRSAKPAIITNVETDSDFAPWAEAAVERGFRSILAVPLSNFGDAFGAITLYSDETGAFDHNTVTNVVRMAETVARGVQSLRSELARKQSQSNLKE
ncbi:MAG: transporter substrate-binding domain-containing protein, partial [Algicola sp.]|nr:transporter substrate-binding domain-containing protein [Algicola sp.]